MMGDLMNTVSNCFVCQSKMVDNDLGVCSEQCRQGREATEEFADQIKLHKNNWEDQRVFFYDVGFGTLVDVYCILLLRRLHQRSLAGQLETDFHLNRVRQSVLTKINRHVADKIHREAITGLFEKLFNINATLWRMRSDAMNEKLPIEERQRLALDYLLRMSDRDKQKSSLDTIVEGHVRLTRVY